MVGDDGAAAVDATAKATARPKRKAATGVAPQAPEPPAPAAPAAPAPAEERKPAEPKPGDAKAQAPAAAAPTGAAPQPDSLVPAASDAAGVKPETASQEEDEDDQEDDGGKASGKQKKQRMGVASLFRSKKAEDMAGAVSNFVGGQPQEYSAEDKPRHWELILTARAFTYVGADKSVDTFFAVSVRPENERARSRVNLLTEYTPAYLLQRNDRFALDNPTLLYDRKKFVLSYHQLQKYVLQIDMWRVSSWTFNQFIGQSRVKLSEIARRSPYMSVKIREKLTKKDEIEKKKMKRPISDVSVFECTVNLEEVFDFHLLLANWRFDHEASHPEAEERLKHQMALTFVMPKNCFSDPLRKKGCRIVRTLWRGGNKKGDDENVEKIRNKESKTRWQKIGQGAFIFRGTRTSLTNQFFIVTLHCGKPMGTSVPFNTIGASFMGLTSVLTISVFKGMVKCLSTEEQYFNVGTLTGSIKALMCCLNEHVVEEVPGGRPEQSKAALNVTSLMRMRYLVIRVTKCEGLAVADSQTFSSDPFLLVVWDNMVQSCPVIKNTTAPVFNHTFYFPVRMFSAKLEHPRYRDTALLYDLRAKGDIIVQVWDDDDSTSADSLGFVRVSLRQILANNYMQKRNLRGKVKEQEVTDDDEEDTKRHKQWYDQEQEVRVFDGAKTELTGCSMPNSQTALIYFEAYFFPDYHDAVSSKADAVLKSRAELNVVDLWRQREKLMDRESSDFARSYSEPFPDAIGAKPAKEDPSRLLNVRRFLCLALHPQTMEQTPLMSFLVKITTDDAYASPMMLLHWMSCITFCNPPSQDRSGLIPTSGWKDPQYMLFTRKGPVQDHALLLCSVLLGAGWEAYVCKGTVWSKDQRTQTQQPEEEKPAHHRIQEPMRLVEHTWVMTREVGGWVTFWEPCTREMYHLPHRWTANKVKRKPDADKPAEDADEVDDDRPVPGDDFTFQVPDVAIIGEEVDQLPVVGAVRRIPKAKEKSKMGARDKLRADQIAQRERLPIAPKGALLNMDETSGTFVDWLPYDSIDVVFNMENLWFNRQNHHPACCLYDFEPVDDSPPGWSKLLKDDEDRKNLPFEYINADVFIDPALKPEFLSALELETVNEMEENMRLYRQKRGHDTWWDKSPDLLLQLNNFLEIHERMRSIDVDLCPLFKKNKEDLTVYEKYILERLHFGKCARPWNKYGNPFTQADGEGARKYRNYRVMQEKSYEELMAVVKVFVDRKKLFPTKKGKVFSGFPVHFCTVDKHEIRRYLMQLTEYRTLLERQEEQLEFTIHCKIHGFLGGVQSCWLYFGVQSPQEEEKGVE